MSLDTPVQALPNISKEQKDFQGGIYPALDWPTKQAAILNRLGNAPWWCVSLALHVLIILLASLVTMSIVAPNSDNETVMVTELQQPPAAQVELEPVQPLPAALDAIR